MEGGGKEERGQRKHHALRLCNCMKETAGQAEGEELLRVEMRRVDVSLIYAHALRIRRVSRASGGNTLIDYLSRCCCSCSGNFCRCCCKFMWHTGTHTISARVIWLRRD